MYKTSQEYKNKILKSSTIQELNIYIDEKKVEDNHIINFKRKLNLFNNNEFCLGSTPEIDIELEIDKIELPEEYNEIYIESGLEDEIIPIGKFIIKNIEDDELKVKITATDYMTKFEKNYDGSKLDYPLTLIEVLNDICKQIGVELGSTSFLNMNKEIAVYDNTVSARTYISYIAEQAGGFAHIGRDGKLYIKPIGQDIIDFDINLFSDYKWGDKFKISRVSYEDGIQNYKFGDETNNTIYISANNMYIVDSEQIENIYNNIKDLEVYSFEGTTIIDPAYDIGDILIIDGKPIIYQGEMEYYSKFKAIIQSKIQPKNENESCQTKPNTATKIRRIQSSINQIDGKIEQLTQETSEYEEKITQVTQDFDKIKQDVELKLDFQRDVSGVSQILLENTSELKGSIFKLQIIGNINFLFPSNTIYPSTTLYPIGQYITLIIDKNDRNNISDEAYKIKIVLSEPLRKLNKEIYDEILIEEKLLKIIRRVGLDSDGNFYKLDSEIVIDFGDFEIPSFKDNTYIYILENSNLTYNASYLVDNEYINTFATKTELNTKVEQSAKGIMTEVNKKVGKDEFGTKIEQNAEAVKYAWNQITQYIQMEVLNGKASLAIRDKDGKLIMSIDQDGQHWYIQKDNVDKNIAETVLVELTENNETKKSLMFVLDNVEMEGDGIMAWGYKANNKVYPMLYMGNFGDEEYGLHFATDLMIHGNTLKFQTASISDDGVALLLNILGALRIIDSESNTWIFQLYKDYDEYSAVLKADTVVIKNSNGTKNIVELYENEAGTKNIDLKNNDITSANNIYSNGQMQSKGSIFTDGNINATGSVYGDNITSMNNCDYFNVTSAGSGDLTVGAKDTGVYLHIKPDWTSDGRLKKDIKDTTVNSLELIKKISHRAFVWKKDERQEKIGYIAQELEEIDENFVTKYEVIDDNGNIVDYDWTINERFIIANLTNALQQQQEIIEKQQEQIDFLMSKIDKKNDFKFKKINKENNKPKEYGEKIIIKRKHIQEKSIRERPKGRRVINEKNKF